MARYYQTQPKPHRVNAVHTDADFPAGTMGAIDTSGYGQCRFDISLNGQDIERVELELGFYNSRKGEWFAGSGYELAAPGRYSIAASTRGATVFLMIKNFSGTSFELSADYAMS